MNYVYFHVKVSGISAGVKSGGVHIVKLLILT